VPLTGASKENISAEEEYGEGDIVGDFFKVRLISS
jgi:hypothetical protein